MRHLAFHMGFWALGIISLLSVGCNQSKVTSATASFYYWQTQLKLTEPERFFLDSLGVKNLYVRFFDVDWDPATTQPTPLAPVEIDTVRLEGLEIIPTIFITNRTFQNIEAPDVDMLARRVLSKINDIYQPVSPDNAPLSYQFDCDWTPSTQEKYFDFLKQTRQQLRTNYAAPNNKVPILSATIRLHQLKFFEKTGVPPVDEGMLMFYNMGDVGDWQTENSILDLSTAAKYRTKTEYPLPLHAALPLFRWAAVFRDGKLLNLIHDLAESDLQDSLYFSKTARNRYLVKQSTYVRGIYMYKDDQLRLESATTRDLVGSVAQLKTILNQQDTEVAFYHLDTSIVRRFPAKILQGLIDGL